MKILISIDKDGGSKVAVTGAPGKKCMAATEGLDKVLGTLGSRHMTQEYNQPEQQGQKVKA